jgi:hypothetical protein
MEDIVLRTVRRKCWNRDLDVVSQAHIWGEHYHAEEPQSTGLSLICSRKVKRAGCLEGLSKADGSRGG